MSNVYFVKTNSHTPVQDIQKYTQKLLETVLENESIQLGSKVPMKVHFGEKGNTSFIKSDNFVGIIDFLKEKDIETAYMETSVMYGGHRHNKKLHLKTAEQHGFTQVPVIIADGEQGEAFSEIEINKKHFKSCKIGEEFSNYDQMIVISHFKGHMLAGFGGAMKQLSMGCASKGGKLAMHMGIKPHIVNRKCKKCNLCKTRCNVDAITIDKKCYIDHEKCVGCGACVSICPDKAVSIFSFKAIFNALFQGKVFKEKLMEYAYAAQKDKQCIYFNYAMNITKGCDCEPRKMKPIMDDFGVFISTDPVAIDKACYDMAVKNGKKFKGVEQFAYAEKIGMGTTQYSLVEVQP